MVVIDATMLLLFLRPETAVSPGHDGLPVERPKDRIDFLISQLNKDRVKIIVPTPALSEGLVRAGAEDTQRIVDHLNRSTVLRMSHLILGRQ
jgi:hypothetical protein